MVEISKLFLTQQTLREAGVHPVHELLKTVEHTVGRDVPNSYFQSRDEKTRLSVPGYKNSGTKDRQNRSFPFQGQCTQKHVKY